uniref:Uncharacterized protein n=1 Tax=Manihot esculenta TaxID=3983 RepID=A0A2C9VS55_MANES
MSRRSTLVKVAPAAVSHSTTSKKVRLPAVFLGGKYVGGAEEIKEMNESGELSKLIGLRYVLCAQCNGSHKIYSEKHGFRTCTSCNVNGLIKCGLCYPGQLYFLIYR